MQKYAPYMMLLDSYFSCINLLWEQHLRDAAGWGESDF